MENTSMSNNQHNSPSGYMPNFNNTPHNLYKSYQSYPYYPYLPYYPDHNDNNIDNLYKNIDALKKDISYLQSLYYHDRMDINIANHYIDCSVKEINKLKQDINQMKIFYDNKYKQYDSRINNAYKKIYKLEKSNKKNINEENNESNDNSPNIETRIIRINGESNNMPLFPLLSMLGGDMKNNNVKKNDLLDSEDEYDDNINLYEQINIDINDDDDDEIIEIDMNINTIDDLIKIGMKYADEIIKVNKDDKVDKDDKVEKDDKTYKDEDVTSTDKIVDNICKKIFADMFKSTNHNLFKKNKKIKIEEFSPESEIEENTNKDNKENNKNKINKINKINKKYYEYNNKKYAIDVKKIVNLIEPLNKLKKLIGMEKIKKQIVDMILYYIQGFEESNSDMLHTSIEGPPGVGKTKLGRILAHIYSALDIIPSKRFKRVRRTDLIGKYLGHTAHKTQEVIDEAEGGVLFIDEAYSLGDNENKDSFSKECIDTINQNLTEKKKKLVVIIAGYTDQLDKTFFALNEGLKRRFPFRFQIDGYNEKEMTEIFYSKMKQINWRLDIELDESFLNEFFKKNKDKFKHFGGDIETLVMNCKMTYASRVIGKKYAYKKILNKTDLDKAFEKYISNKKKVEEMNDSVKMFYS